MRWDNSRRPGPSAPRGPSGHGQPRIGGPSHAGGPSFAGQQPRGSTGLSAHGTSGRRPTSPGRRGGGNPLLWVVIALVIVAVIVLLLWKGGEDPQPSNPLPSTPQSTDPLPTNPPQPSDPIPETQPPATSGGLVYTDERVPNYQQTDPKWERLEFEWESQDRMHIITLTMDVDANMYKYYRDLPRYYSVEEYGMYIMDANNRSLVQGIVGELRKLAEKHSYAPTAAVREIAKFVQDVIEYQYDDDTTGESEYPRYPMETLYERQGDCEDTTILMAALLRELGFVVGFLEFPGHVAVALATDNNYSGGDYYEINGQRYLYIESTGSGWNIGDIPDDYKNVSATFHPVD